MPGDERDDAIDIEPSPRVSVVIPAYNREGSIRDAVNSVLNQSLADIEVIVVDDASVDRTREVLGQITDGRLRVIALPENRGAGAARNVGVQAARGAWVAFQDSDDEWLPSKLTKQMARIDASDSEHVAVYCGMLVLGFRDDGASAKRTDHDVSYIPNRDTDRIEGDLTRELLWRNLVSTQTLVVRREVIEVVGPFDERLPALEDWEFALRLAQHGSIACVDEALVIQRLSANSLSRDFTRNVAARRSIVDEHAALFSRDPKALAHQYYTLAGGYRRIGDLHEARHALQRARAARPLELRLWAMSILVKVMTVTRIARSRRSGSA